MPIIYTKNIESIGKLAVWQITEPASYFIERLQLFPKEEDTLKTMRPRRKLEWLAWHLLVHLLSEKQLRIECIKDEYGKPYLKGSNLNISVSHSHKQVAVIISQQKVGIDIQRIENKIERIAYKFVNKEEMKQVKPITAKEHFHVYWGAKEALFKAYGKCELDFKKHLLVEPFQYGDKYTIKGLVSKNKDKEEYQIQYSQLHNYMLVYVVQQEFEQSYL